MNLLGRISYKYLELVERLREKFRYVSKIVCIFRGDGLNTSDLNSSLRD